VQHVATTTGRASVPRSRAEESERGDAAELRRAVRRCRCRAACRSRHRYCRTRRRTKGVTDANGGTYRGQGTRARDGRRASRSSAAGVSCADAVGARTMSFVGVPSMLGEYPRARTRASKVNLLRARTQQTAPVVSGVRRRSAGRKADEQAGAQRARASSDDDVHLPKSGTTGRGSSRSAGRQAVKRSANSTCRIRAIICVPAGRGWRVACQMI
jgi:hypothetical protein